MQALLPGGAKSSQDQRRARSGREKKSHKEICLPPCKMAALKHLFGDDGSLGRRTQGCSGSVKSPELGGCGKQPWKAPSALCLQPLVGSIVPDLPSQTGRPEARASSPWPLTPVYKHSLGAGWGRPERGLEGWKGGCAQPRTPPAEKNQELVRESGPGSWKGLKALFLKLSIPSTPIVRASCKTSQAF